MWLADLHDQVTRVQRRQATSECRTGGMVLGVQSVRSRCRGVTRKRGRSKSKQRALPSTDRSRYKLRFLSESEAAPLRKKRLQKARRI